MLDSIVKAIRAAAGVRVEERQSLHETSYRWRRIADDVWHPKSGEPQLFDREAVARAMNLPEPATRGVGLVTDMLRHYKHASLRADYDRYSSQFEVEEVTGAHSRLPGAQARRSAAAAADDDDDVDLEGDAALLRRCVDAGVAAARAYRRRAPRERSGQGGRGGRPRPPAGGRGRGLTRRGLYKFIGRPPAPAPAPAAPAPAPAAPAPPPPPQPPANSSSDSSSSSSSDSDDSAGC